MLVAAILISGSRSAIGQETNLVHRVCEGEQNSHTITLDLAAGSVIETKSIAGPNALVMNFNGARTTTAADDNQIRWQTIWVRAQTVTSQLFSTQDQYSGLLTVRDGARLGNTGKCRPLQKFF
jgi:hypothetical protein